MHVVITLALLLVARRALAATVLVAPLDQLVAPGSRAPDLTRPASYLSLLLSLTLPASAS